MSCQQSVEVAEEVWRPASAAVRASLLQLLFGPLDGAQNVAPMAGVGTARVGGQRVEPGNLR